MTDALEVRLAALAASGRTITYGDLARDIGLTGPGRIGQLTAALEFLMEQDAATGRPLRAVLCEARLANGLPARGFFAKALALGRFQSNDHPASVAAERALLFSAALQDQGRTTG